MSTPEPSPRQPATSQSTAPPKKPRTAAVADSRTRQARGNHRRRQILDAAVEVFAARGYQRAGVAALAERVGMTATGLLYYFGSKERLLHEVVAERDRSAASSPVAELTLSGLREIGKHNVESASLTRLYVVLGAENLDAEEPLHDFFVRRYETARGLVRQILEIEQSEGRVRLDVDIDQIARETIGVIMGVEIQWLTDPDHVDLDLTVRHYIDRLIVDLAP